MGHVYDVLDTDPRHGGDDSFDALLHELAGDLPNSYGYVSTPSGGWHNWIVTLGIGKHTNFWKSAGWNGLDLQGGRPDGSSVGFVFIPPTERKSKVDGKVSAYTWDEPPENPESGDTSGMALSRLIVENAGSGRTATGTKKNTAQDGTGKMLTYPEIRRYIKHGIPEDETQDVTLARCVWAWRVQHAQKEWAFKRWQTIVDKTTLTDPGWKFTRKDFDRHWKGADEKRSEQEAAEREARRERDDDDEEDDGDDLETRVNDRCEALLVDQMARAKLAARGWTAPVAYDEDAIEKLPDPVSLITGVLDLGMVGELTGFTGTAKSFLALDWGMCIAHGVPWMPGHAGHEAGYKVRQGNVVYVAAEDGAGLKFRTRAWRKRHRVSRGKSISFYIEAVNLANDAQVDWLVKTVQADKASFVMLDTYDKCTVGAEENSSTDTGKIVANLYRLRNANGPNSVTVLIVHHTGCDKKRGRGSTGLPSGIDYVFHMEAEDDDPHIYTELKAVKRKNAPLPATMGFRLVEVDGTGSCILQQVDVAAPKADARSEQSDATKEKIRKARQENPGAKQAEIIKIMRAAGTKTSKTTVSKYWKETTPQPEE